MTSGLVAFSSDRDGDWEIFVMKPDGTKLRQLTNNDLLSELVARRHPNRLHE